METVGRQTLIKMNGIKSKTQIILLTLFLMFGNGGKEELRVAWVLIGVETGGGSGGGCQGGVDCVEQGTSCICESGREVLRLFIVERSILGLVEHGESNE